MKTVNIENCLACPCSSLGKENSSYMKDGYALYTSQYDSWPWCPKLKKKVNPDTIDKECPIK